MDNPINPFAIHLERSYHTTPDAIYKLLINGAKFGEVTGMPGKGGGMEGAFFSIQLHWVSVDEGFNLNEGCISNNDIALS